MARAEKSETPKWILIGTGVLSLIAAGLVLIVRYYEINKARAEADQARVAAERTRTEAERPRVREESNAPVPSPRPAPSPDPNVVPDLAMTTPLPRNALDQLPGAWRVSFVGLTRNGSAIDYQATWEFGDAGAVWSVDAKIGGKWACDYKARRVVITWDNAEMSQESFPLPLNPAGMTGQTWHGPGVTLTAKKVPPK